LSAFVIVFTACGLNFAFGVYQALYEAMSKEPDNPFTGANPALIDLIGTIAISLMTILAPFSTAWTKRFPPHMVIGAGGIIFALSLLLASFSQQLWQFELTQGVLMGVGTCLLYMPAVTVCPPWFNEHRGLAMGFILAGTGVGGVVWAPALRALNDKIGFRNTLRLSSGVSLVLCLAAGSKMKWHPSMRARSQNASLFKVPLIDWKVAKTRKFQAQALGAMFQSAAYYIPVFFFAAYARTLGYSDSAGANFIALSNAANAIGKVVIGYLADRVGRLNALFITTLLSAFTTLGLWLPSVLLDGGETSKSLFIAFALCYGVFASAYVSLFPTSLVELFGVQHFANVNGVLYMLRGLATMVGTPVAGALIRDTGRPKAYEATSSLAGGLLASAALAVFWVRLEASKGTRKWKQ
jgi:MFS family permease